jgi:hypothetical protein
VKCVEEGGGLRLRSSSVWCCSCVRDEVALRYRFHHHHIWVWLKLRECRRQSVFGDINAHRAVGCFGQLNLNTQAQSVCLSVESNCALSVGREVCVLVSDDSSIVPLTRSLGCS